MFFPGSVQTSVLIAQSTAPTFAEYCDEISELCDEIRRALRRNPHAELCIPETQYPKMVICGPVAARDPGVAGVGRPTGEVPSGARGTPPATLVCARGVPGKVETAFRPPFRPKLGGSLPTLIVVKLPCILL